MDLTQANTSSAEVYGFNLGFTASTVNYTVTVASYGGGNKFHILGIPQNTLELMEGNTYVYSLIHLLILLHYQLHQMVRMVEGVNIQLG